MLVLSRGRHRPPHSSTQPPPLALRPAPLPCRDANGPRSEVPLRSPLRLFSYAGYNFWRWDLSVEVLPVPRVVQYGVWCSTDSALSRPIM